MEPQQGWHRDPTGRFEYRYFNGVQWTSDVAINGQRYVDSPIDQVRPAIEPRRPRGLAIAAFVTGISGVAIGWIPFVFVAGVGAAIAAIVLGVLGLRTARRHEGYGRGFAIAGLALSPVALAVCVGGFFFTKALVRELRDFVDPGPHEVFVQQPCTFEDGVATVDGTITNLDDRSHSYRIFVDFRTDDKTELATVAVDRVAPGDEVPWSASEAVVGTSVECAVTDVFGPTPFDIDTQD